MKKKLLVLLLSLCALFGILGITACDNGSATGGNSLPQSSSKSESSSENSGGGNQGGDENNGGNQGGEENGGTNVAAPTEGLAYTLSNDESYYICTGMGTNTAIDIVIADTYDDLLVKEIANSAFAYEALTSVKIGNNVTSIGYSAFRYCSSLKSVSIGNGVTSIGNDAFSACSSLTSIIVDENNTKLKSIDGNLYTKDETTLVQYALGKVATEFAIPDSVTSIGNYAFYYCDNLTSITIPDSVTSIGALAFSNCDNLTSITIPDSVTSIREYAFGGCDSLTSITIPDSVTSIGNGAFYECNQIIVKENGIYYVDGWAIDCDTSITIAKLRMDTRGIADNAFYNCDNLTSITIPDSVTSIGEYAFYNCSSLTSVTIGNGVTSIGEYAFRNCSSLTSVTIGNGVTSIGYDAFYYCTSLTSVTIGNGVTSIGYDAFYYCTSLTSVYYEGTESEWNSISIGTFNSSLTSATRYYYSESQPTDEGNYWHYDTDGKTPVIW